MMKKRHILHWAMGVVLTPLLGSCAFDELHEIAGGGDGMSFSVEVTQLQEELGSSFRAPRITDTEISGDGMKMYVRRTTEGYVHRHEAKGVATRGTSVSSIDKFVLNSYSYNGTMSSSATPVSSNENITSTGGWKSSKQWQNVSDNMAFYAYNAGTSSATFSLDESGKPKLQYTVADAVADQQDLLVAKAENVTGDGTNTPVSLTFSHALTAVQFGIGSTMANGTIKKIELQGIKNSGTYNYTDGTWSLQSGSQTYTIDNLSINISGNKGTSTATKIITGSNNDLMLLMPQTLSGAKLVVTIESGGTPHDLEMSLSGEWKPGHTVTYSLSTTKEDENYVLKVENASLLTDKDGGSVSTKVTSYYQDYYGTQKAVEWTATYAFASGTDERTPLDKALTAKTESGNGGTAGETLSATIAKQYPKSDKTLSTDNPKGTEDSPFDLSTYNPATGATLSGANQKSANCYVVNAPGWYKIPLYYGNSLNNTNGYGTNTFQTHDGTTINSSTCNFASSVSSGKLLWQDEYALITPSSIQKDGDYLKFYVSPKAIAQGNAVIAAMSGANGTGNILWSWHIWVTNMDLTKRVNILSGANRNVNYPFMTKPVGYCEAATLSYPERVINVSIMQATSNNTTAVTIKQSSTATINVAQNCTFYQWGRKDPFPGASSDNNTVSVQKLCYDADGNAFVYAKKGGNTTSGNGKQTMAGSIQNPTTFYYSKTSSGSSGDANYDDVKNDWCTVTYNDNWSNSTKTGFDDDVPTKTVYDPCPIGFKMPGSLAFTRFTTNGNNYSDSQYFNVSNKTAYGTDKGWNFYIDNSNNTDFWYAFGFIDCWTGRYTANSGTGKGCLAYAGFNGLFWSARAYSAGLGCYLNFFSGNVYPRATNLRAYGFAARPVSE